MTAPRLTFIPGANGCGKTTLTRWNADLFREIPVLDPDTIGNTLQSTVPSTSPIAAARQVLKSAKEHINRAESFAIETTLAGKHYLQMMLDARHRGFEIVLVYIGTGSVEINLARIRDRVSRVATMYRKATSDGATSGVFRIFPSPSSARTIPSCSTTKEGVSLGRNSQFIWESVDETYT